MVILFFCSNTLSLQSTYIKEVLSQRLSKVFQAFYFLRSIYLSNLISLILKGLLRIGKTSTHSYDNVQDGPGKEEGW